jgi:hypothetical protein
MIQRRLGCDLSFRGLTQYLYDGTIRHVPTEFLLAFGIIAAVILVLAFFYSEM